MVSGTPYCICDHGAILAVFVDVRVFND
jgi:hypothetical protein